MMVSIINIIYVYSVDFYDVGYFFLDRTIVVLLLVYCVGIFSNNIPALTISYPNINNEIQKEEINMLNRAIILVYNFDHMH